MEGTGIFQVLQEPNDFGCLIELLKLFLELLQQCQAEIYHPDAPSQHNQTPHLLGNLAGETVQIVGHEPLEHPGLSSHSHLLESQE